MAFTPRTYETILAEIKTQIRTYPSLNIFLFPEDGGSAVSTFNLIISTIAQAIFIFEQIISSAIASLTTIANQTHGGNAAWIQQQILNFQYGDIIGFVNGVPAYNPVDPTHRVVTQCAVTVNPLSGLVTVKVAGGAIGSLAPISGAQLIALKAYYFGYTTQQGVGFAGVITQFVNLNPDRMQVQANIYYYGQYVAATVQAAVIAAIQNFFNTFQTNDFGGTVFVTGPNSLREAIEAVPGVSRCYFTLLTARSAITAFGSSVTVDSQGIYITNAGYLIPEDTSGHTLSDTITMIQETA